MSGDQFKHVMTSSPGHGDAFILSVADASNRRIMTWSLKINPFSGIGLVSELFDPPTYIANLRLIYVPWQNPFLDEYYVCWSSDQGHDFKIHPLSQRTELYVRWTKGWITWVSDAPSWSRIWIPQFPCTSRVSELFAVCPTIPIGIVHA